MDCKQEDIFFRIKVERRYRREDCCVFLLPVRTVLYITVGVPVPAIQVPVAITRSPPTLARASLFIVSYHTHIISLSVSDLCGTRSCNNKRYGGYGGFALTFRQNLVGAKKSTVPSFLYTTQRPFSPSRGPLTHVDCKSSVRRASRCRGAGTGGIGDGRT